MVGPGEAYGAWQGLSGIHDPFLFDGLQVAGGEVLRKMVSVTTSALLPCSGLKRWQPSVVNISREALVTSQCKQKLSTLGYVV